MERWPLSRNEVDVRSSWSYGWEYYRKIKSLGGIENQIKLNSLTDNEYLTKGNNINKIDILFKKIEKNND